MSKRPKRKPAAIAAKVETRQQLIDRVKFLETTITQRDLRITDLAAARDEHHKRADDNYTNGLAWKADTKKAEQALEKSREHFAELKEKLFRSEMDRARLIGMLDRVREQDTAGQPPVTRTVTTEGPAKQVLPLQGWRNGQRPPGEPAEFRPSIYAESNAPRNKHWTDL